MSVIGVSGFRYAKVTSDTAAGITYDPVVAVPGLVSLNVDPEIETAENYYDNGLGEVYKGIKKLTCALALADIPAAMFEDVFGCTREAAGTSINRNTVSKDIAIGYERLKANGTRRRVWLYKGKFGLFSEKNTTKGESTEFKNSEMSGEFAFPTYDVGKAWAWADEEDPLHAAVFADFLTAPAVGDTTPPTVTCVPADAATGVAVDANVVLTFSEAMNTTSLVVGESFVLQKSDGTMVAGAGVWSVGNTVYTFNPTSALSGAYLATVTSTVKDLSGNKLAAANSFNFATV